MVAKTGLKRDRDLAGTQHSRLKMVIKGNHGQMLIAKTGHSVLLTKASILLNTTMDESNVAMIAINRWYHQYKNDGMLNNSRRSSSLYHT